jgi:uncharacterized protein YkwD
MRPLRAAALCFVTLMESCVTLLPPVSTGSGTPSSGTPAPSSASIAADVVRYTNDARARNGLKPLASNSRLMEAARIHAEQMAAYQRMDHTISGAQYPTLQSRLQAVSYVYMNAAENVAWNSATPQAVVNGWMNSSGHRANILDSRLTEIGAAMARSSKGEPYWIQVFGTPR